MLDTIRLPRCTVPLVCAREAGPEAVQQLPGESHGQRSMVGYSPRGHRESDMTEVT